METNGIQWKGNAISFSALAYILIVLNDAGLVSSVLEGRLWLREAEIYYKGAFQ